METDAYLGGLLGMSATLLLLPVFMLSLGIAVFLPFSLFVFGKQIYKIMKARRLRREQHEEEPQVVGYPSHESIEKLRHEQFHKVA